MGFVDFTKLLFALSSLALPYTVRRKIFATEKVRESLPKRGGRNFRDKNIREGGSAQYYNMGFVFVWLVGSLTVDESFSVLFAVACL